MVGVRLLLVAGLFALRSSDASAAIFGVAPEDQGKYTGSSFSCFDKPGVGLPTSAINDDFCDCEDGSDEPGTSACAGQSATLFYCVNSNSVPKKIYTAQVKDGICDCCDGSDEVGGPCGNTCVEEGKAWFAERDKRIETLTQGIGKRDQTKQEAQQKRAEWQAEIDKLKAELPDLEKAHAGAQEALKIPAAVSAKFEVLEKQIKSMQQEIKDLRKRQKDLAAENKKLKASIGGGAVDAEPAAGEEKKEKAQISEYTKWMEGATDKILENKGDEGKEQAGSEEPAGEDEGGEEDEDSDSSSSSSSGDDAVSSANSKVQENKRKVREIEEKMTMLADDKLHHFGLVDKCISKRDAEYEYKLCFFKDAHQDHVSLGRWDDWTGPMTASFKHGAMCPGGPERSLNVIFECGVEDEITRLGEPSRCVYEAVVRTAGACDPAQLEIEKAEPKPRTPKDEL